MTVPIQALIIMVPPYKAPHISLKENRRFNKRLSSIRIDIEHAFGMLKGRWKSLTALRLRLLNNKQFEFAIIWITACVVLHNVLLELNDEWAEEEGWWTPDEEEEHDEDIILLSEAERRVGTIKRGG